MLLRYLMKDLHIKKSMQLPQRSLDLTLFMIDAP